MPAGTFANAVPSCEINVSLKALRFAGRLRRT